MLPQSHWSIQGMRNRTPAYGTICHVAWKMMWASLKTHATLAHDQPPFVVPNQAIRPNCNPAAMHSTLALSLSASMRQATTKGPPFSSNNLPINHITQPATGVSNSESESKLAGHSDNRCWLLGSSRTMERTWNEWNKVKRTVEWSGTWHGMEPGQVCSALAWSGLAWPGRDVINDFD